jgi:hypothetical protein
MGCKEEVINPDMKVGRIFNSFFTTVFNPATLTPFLWVDAVHGDYSSSEDTNGTRQPGNIIDSASDEMGKTLTIGSTGTKPIYNGVSWFFDTLAQFTQGTASDYNFLHNGNDFEIFLTYFQCPANTGNARALLNNNGFSSTARGILLYYDNTGGTNSLKLRIGNGSSNVISIDASGAITQNAVNKIRIKKSGNTVTLYVGGVQVGQQTNSTWNASNAAAVLAVCSSSSASAMVYLLDLFIIDRVLTTDEATNMNGRTLSVPACTDINTYFIMGDSNGAGRGVNADIAADLTGTINSFIERFNSASPSTNTSWVGKLLLGTNQTIPSEFISTLHGVEMRFAKSMSAVGDSFIIKYGIGSTSCIYNWNPSLPSDEYYKVTSLAIPVALIDIVHAKRRNPVFRGFAWVQGANDAAVGGDDLAWTRSGTTITVTQSSHPRSTGQSLPVVESSDLTALPLGDYTMTKIDANTFTIQGVNAGGTSGTMTYSGGSKYKSLFTSIFNGIIDTLGTLKNHSTGGTGYTVNKMRLYIAKTHSGAFPATSYADTIAAQQDIGDNYLTDNPSYSSKVLGSTCVSTEDLALQDAAHYTTAAYDTLGGRIYAYFSQYVNE